MGLAIVPIGVLLSVIPPRNTAKTTNQQNSMKDNDKNKAQATLEWCNARFAEGRTVYFSTQYKHIRVTPKNKDAIKVSRDGLRVGGKLVTSNTQLLVKVSAGF